MSHEKEGFNGFKLCIEKKAVLQKAHELGILDEINTLTHGMYKRRGLYLFIRKEEMTGYIKIPDHFKELSIDELTIEIKKFSMNSIMDAAFFASSLGNKN